MKEIRAVHRVHCASVAQYTQVIPLPANLAKGPLLCRISLVAEPVLICEEQSNFGNNGVHTILATDS